MSWITIYTEQVESFPTPKYARSYTLQITSEGLTVQFQPRRWVKQNTNRIKESFVRRIDRSISFRLLLSLLLAYCAVFTVREIEVHFASSYTCDNHDTIGCLFSEFLSVITVENIEGFSILVVANLYLLESRDRKQKKHYEAWQVVDQAAAAKVPTSYARIKALQDLNEDGVSLYSLDLPKADLRNINLRGADLRECTLPGVIFKNANLENANLENSNLTAADLSEANLTNANLKGVNFKLANLSGANLSGANLSKANLSKATLADAELSGVNLFEANLAGTSLTNANLGQANLKGARLRETHREGANFKGANLKGATMPDGSIHN